MRAIFPWLPILGKRTQTQDGASTTGNGQDGQAGDECVAIETPLGNLTLKLWTDVAPRTVENFKRLVRAGFYDGTCFHRVVKGFMIQGGDPLTRDESAADRWGTGGPGYTIGAEFNNRPHRLGVISMARSVEPDSAGSQFFICLANAPFLDRKYTAFGELMEGHGVLLEIGAVAVTSSPGGEVSRPIQRVQVDRIRLVPGG